MLNWMKKAAVAAAIAIASSTIVAPPAGAIAGGRVNNADSLALLIFGWVAMLRHGYRSRMGGDRKALCSPGEFRDLH